MFKDTLSHSGTHEMEEKMKRRASLTVEASLILPVFLYAMLFLAYIGKLVICQDEVQWALTRIAREASAEYGATHSDKLKSTLYYQTKFAAYMKGSGLTVSFADSQLLQHNDEIDLVVTYRMKLPFSIFAIPAVSMRQRVHTRAFTGVERRQEKKQDERIVYITETGRVYHLTAECTYLKLSISQIQYSDLQEKRNESGGKYKPCERCGADKEREDNMTVWITSYGDRYHTSLSCSGLKRHIREIPLSETGGRSPCGKCANEK